MALNIERLLVTTDDDVKRYLRIAYQVAWDHSQDNKTKTGAIIIRGPYDIFDYKSIIGYGFNHLTPGVKDLPEWNERPLKYDGMVHSEIDSITKAAKSGVSTDGAIMVMPWVPCTRCYVAMRNSGIHMLLAHRDIILKSPPHWEEDLNKTLFLMEKDGFEMILYDGKIGGVKSLFDGKVWEP